MTGNLYYYDSEHNTVHELADKIDYQEFLDHSGHPDQFWVETQDLNGRTTIYTSDGQECFSLLTDRQTVDQAIILVATMLGMRSAAME